MTKVSENFSCFTKPTGPFFAAMASSVRRVRGRPTVFHVSPASTTSTICSAPGIPTLGTARGGDDIHAVDERARVKDLVAAAKIYANLLTTFGG